MTKLPNIFHDTKNFCWFGKSLLRFVKHVLRFTFFLFGSWFDVTCYQTFCMTYNNSCWFRKYLPRFSKIYTVYVTYRWFVIFLHRVTKYFSWFTKFFVCLGSLFLGCSNIFHGLHFFVWFAISFHRLSNTFQGLK